MHITNAAWTIEELRVKTFVLDKVLAVCGYIGQFGQLMNTLTIYFLRGGLYCASNIRLTHSSPGGVLAEKLGRGVRPVSQNPYPIYDQNLRFSLPYL